LKSSVANKASGKCNVHTIDFQGKSHIGKQKDIIRFNYEELENKDPEGLWRIISYTYNTSSLNDFRLDWSRSPDVVAKII
jgi:hypothetical protein